MATMQSKEEHLRALLASPEVDLWQLRELALSEGGLVTDTIRHQAWPKLVGLHAVDDDEPDGDDEEDEPTTTAAPQTSPRRSMLFKSPADVPLVCSQDLEQVELDVLRCTWHLLTGTQRIQSVQMEFLGRRNKKIAKLIAKKQQKLAHLINLALLQSPRLHYYQGYHDVACILLTALAGANNPKRLPQAKNTPNQQLSVALGVLTRMSQFHLHNCMQADFRSLQNVLHDTLMPLLALLDPVVHDYVQDAGLELPTVCLSWILTWFAHDIRDTELVKRLFDAFLVSHPLFPVYVSVAMMLHPHNRHEIMTTECDFALLHQTIRHLPRNSSIFGWKYQPGDGYVSDHGAMEDSTVSTSSSWETYADPDMVVEELEASEHGLLDRVDTDISDPITLLLVAVPFQELIDAALGYMDRVPPAQLPALAQRYYSECKPATLFAGFPAWFTAAHAKSDWVLRKEARGQQGMTTTLNRRTRRKRASAMAERCGTMKEHRRADIAVGLGQGTIAPPKKNRRDRRSYYVAAAVVVVLAVACWVFVSRRQPADATTSAEVLPPVSNETFLANATHDEL